MFWDKELKGTTHFNKLTSSLSYTIRNIAWIRHLIDRDTTKILMQALVLSKYNQSKLQRVQNMAARVIFKLWKHNHITLHLSNLHWLKVAERIDFKVAILVFKCLRGMALKYLQELITTKCGHTGLTSSTNEPLPITRSRIAFVHNRSFSSVGLRLWNSIPIAI